MATREDRPEHRDGVVILIVDDYQPNLTALTAVLQSLGEDVHAVSSGARALAELERRDYAVVILDVQMPEMDGIQVAKRIRASARNANVPIIFLTAMESDAAQVLEGYAAGAVDYVRKPFEPVILRSKVGVFVELHRRGERIKREVAARAAEETARAAAERVSHEKDQFLAVLSHELRTPLTSILLWSERLLNRQLDAATIDRAHRTIDRCARLEARMVENVLEMSRIVTGSLELDLGAVNLAQVVTDVVVELSAFACEQQSTLRWDRPAGDWTLRGDAQRLREIVYNLVSNAVKFSPGGQVAVSLQREPSRLSIRVADTGAGFDPRTGADLFAAFKQADSSSTRVYGGLGLGLPVARELVARHGGSITAHSDGLGRGACFTVSLPEAAPDGGAPPGGVHRPG